MKEVRQPDRKAPRIRLETFSILGRTIPINGCKHKDPFYYLLLRQYPELAKYSRKEVNDIIYNFNKSSIVNEIYTNPNGVELPYNLGIIFMGKWRLPNGRAIAKDINGKRYKIMTRNDHTDGYTPRIYYTNWTNKIRLVNADYWGFIPCRDLRTGMGKVFIDNWRIYHDTSGQRFPGTNIRNGDKTVRDKKVIPRADYSRQYRYIRKKAEEKEELNKQLIEKELKGLI